MTPGPSTLPGHLEASPESVAAFEWAANQLPREALPEILARIKAGVEHVERTGDVAPLRHTLDSLLTTAALQHNQAYLLAVADADAEDARGVGEPVEVAEFVARMRQRHGQ